MFEDKNNGHTCYCENCLKLQAENEFKDSEINDWIKQYKLAHQKYMKLQTKNEKYKQCLDEIKECIECCTTTMYGCGNCNKGDECNGSLSDLILQKIKEVKGNE